MRKLNLTILVSLFFSGSLLSQTTDSTKVENQTTEFTIFGKSWKVIKYEDGTKSYEWETDKEEYSHSDKHPSKFHYNFLESEVGINVWPVDKGAPKVKPWGSWYVALQSEGTWKATKNFHLKSYLGVNWYNFKFEDPGLVAIKTPGGIDFVDYTDVVENQAAIPTKSKISASYATLTLIPSLQTNDGKMRIGAGGYLGYRLGGRGKFVYELDGEKVKDFTKSNMYAANFRYGVRGEIGIADVTLFFNYDLNNFFEDQKGPELQAISFGVRIN
ncbi:hypothetical protein [Algoriphagus mannitolivorans]|uniref:hypothetical protein n=1 Tax=Algoriphagus mannitolivorans TaxID=226504 RepID=UPI00040CC773|nr:hypothetical protein [Algoriphagus mannitolivorans]